VALRRKSKDAKVELLRGVPLFAACSKRELSRIASLADEIEVPEGRVLTREGDPGWECFVVVDGRATITVGDRARVAPLGSGACFGEMSLLDQGPRSATVEAQTDMHLLVLDARSFSSMLEEFPSVARKMLATMAGRLRVAEREATH
jgi:CRP/FNR family transcriptional regulator, cyclic AMP receptor protein